MKLQVENKRPYTWEEIKSVLVAELKKTKHIMTYGTRGSLNVQNDIDTIITKKPRSKSSDFYRELHNLFDKVDKYLNDKYNARLIRFSRFSDEEEVKFISGYRENDLLFHIMAYVSLGQIEMHWNDSLTPSQRAEGLTSRQKVRNILKEGYTCLIGNANDLFKQDFKSNKNEELFILLNDFDRINSHFPKKLLITKMNVLFDFILRKMLGLRTLKANSEKEVRENFYKVCDIIDKSKVTIK